MIQGAEDTGDSGCEVHDGRRKKKRRSSTVPWCSTRQTVHQDADNIADAVKHFVLVLKEVDAETFYAVRHIILALDVLLDLQHA